MSADGRRSRTNFEGLTQAIAQYAQSPEQLRELDLHAREIREELGRQAPDKSKLAVMLERIASGAQSIAPIFELAMKLKSIIAALL